MNVLWQANAIRAEIIRKAFDPNNGTSLFFLTQTLRVLIKIELTEDGALAKSLSNHPLIVLA
jgi:hypothetical protein